MLSGIKRREYRAVTGRSVVQRTGAGWVAKLTRAGCVAAALAIACAGATGQEPDQFPQPLAHTPTDHPAAHVILLSVDGLHAVDLANWVAGHPKSALAELTRRGVTYTNAHTPVAAPVAGLISIVTGGTPISTGIVGDDGFDHSLAPPDPSCRRLGSPIGLDGQMDSATTAQGFGLDSLKYPRDANRGCTPVPPHSLLRVNTIFEVVHQKSGPTGWVGENATVTEMLKGPSGQGLDDSCSLDRPTKNVDPMKSAHDDDEARVAYTLRWIDALDCTGKMDFQVPALFGMSFVSVAAAQANPGMGYVDATGTPSAGLARSFAFVDDAIGRMVKELKAKKLSIRRGSS